MSDHEPNLCETCLQDEYEEFSHKCIHESMDQNKLWMEKFAIGTWPRWDYSMEDATLIFSKDGKPKVVCSMQVVGSTNEKSWQWSWGNKHYPSACKSLMDSVRQLGEEKGWDRLTTLFLESDEYIGWECASVASHVLNGIGAYRCPTGSGGSENAVYVVILSAQFVN